MTDTVLIVEDNPLMRLTLEKHVAGLGYQVHTAEHGCQALEEIEKHSIDVILLDLMMPVMDGFTLLEHLKKCPDKRQIPTIVLSSAEEEAMAVRSIEMGAEDHLVKPFNPVFLKARLQAAAEKKHFIAEIAEERAYSDSLLHVLLPTPIINELKETNTVQPKRHDDVAVLFCDIVQFTRYCDEHPPEKVLSELQTLIEAYDGIIEEHHLQKISTMGDSVLITGGLLEPLANPTLSCIECGAEMIKRCQQICPQWKVRVGIHIGPVIAGTAGSYGYRFDIWGDTVNTASRMETQAVPNSVTLSEQAYRRVEDLWPSLPSTTLEVKGKGTQTLYQIEVIPEGAPV